MKVLKLKDYTRGWIIGDITPAILQTKAFEFCVKDYMAGDSEAAHVHKVATEISVVVTGSFKMNNTVLKAGDVLVMEPNDVGQFSCLEDGSIAVVKIPSVRGDKYLVEY
ncbi:MAG: hypothetical protein UX89_C0001G0011 [Parcubacteria group bacterium GW2011_GWA2_47_16]|nr:MAG: hypothetical protein UX89_C0001G0011 [Parcubacteria group bacterium GW2011_GWA2_47_16]